MALLMLGTVFMELAKYYQADTVYKLSSQAEALVGTPKPHLAQSLKFDAKQGAYMYNQNYKPGVDIAGQAPGPKFTGSFNKLPEKGATVTDPVTQTSVTFKPEYKTAEPVQDQNRLIYPLKGRDGQKVYTLKSIGLKEDIILNKMQGETASFVYQLELSEGTEARLESNGSLAIYGVQAELLGSVTTSTEKDAELLKKARENGPKNKLLFTFPAPFVKESGKRMSKVKTWFELQGKELTIHAAGLGAASYPLSIDPTVYIETAAKLMRGNNESNIDFDIDNELIQKSQTTGARIDAWTDTSNMNDNLWGHSVAAAGGYVYAAGGNNVASTTTVYSSTGSGTFNVPSGVTSITVKVWGAGGGGGGGGSASSGGAGGGGGYATAVLTVTPLESLNVYVGSGGGAGTGRSDSGDGGGGGGHSEINRGGTNLIIASGGGGGGGGDNSSATAGGAGGAGGTTTGIAGSASGTAGGGGAGTGVGGGAGGTGGSNAGDAGGSETAGDGGDGNTADTDGGANNGGAADDGDGGTGSVADNFGAGGGGGGGLFGGGGGSGSATGNAGGGGGGSGSCMTTGTSNACTAGSGTTPGNSSDSDRSGVADGGAGGGTTATGTAGEAGRIVISYVTSSTVSTEVNWAKFNNSTSAIDSPNPGSGTCSGWCTSSAYNLPGARTGGMMTSYNGFLYFAGGSTDGAAANGQTNFWVAKLGANGEPALWHPTGGTAAYWHQSSNTLPTARSRGQIYAYNNKMYLVGGRDTSGNSISNVHVADILPTGDIGAWSTTGMQDLTTPTARYDHSIHVYNDVMYIIGGNNNGTLRNTVYYSRLNSDGTMNTWTATSNFTTARSSFGGVMTGVWGAYIYIAGGCSALSSGNCSTIASDVQLASINADGSLSEWNTVLNLENARIGYSFVAWQNGLYRFGGCTSQNTSTGACNNAISDVEYGVVNPDGEASTVATSSASGAAPCSGGSPYNCNLPSASVGNMLNASVVVNGYLYIMGGCTNNACTTYSTGITYQAIGSDGSLQRPASCTGSYTDSYCVSSTALPSARAAPGVATFNGRIYLIGGFPTITNISYVSVNNDGSIGAWSNTDFTDIAVNGIDDDVSYTFAYARANPSAASSIPGNLFIFGGCTGDTSGIGCSSYSDSVYKCDLSTTGVPSNCTVTGQTQIGTVAGASGSGLGAHAGTVYANYIYLMGGLAPGVTDLTTVYIAKFDNSNNVVESDGAGTTAWTRASNDILVGRRRGAGFGYNGYLYVTGGYDGTSALADIEFAKIDVSTGQVGGWDASSVSINRRWGLTVPVSNSYAYVIGGCTDGAAPSSCSTRTNTIQTFQIYNNDSGTIKSVSSLSDDTFGAGTDRVGTSAAIYNGYLYVAGGCTTINCSAVSNNVQRAAISAADGSVGSWSGTTDATMPLARGFGQLEVAGGTLYYMGGVDGAGDEKSEVFYGPIVSDNVSAWSQATTGLPQDRAYHGATVWNNRLYVVGGINDSAAVTSTVYVSPQMSSGGDITGAWTSSTAFNVARTGTAVTAYANNLYLFGGFDGTNYLNDSQFTQINSDGTVDSWSYSTSLPVALRDAEAFAANGYMYVVGGRSGTSSCVPNTLTAPVSANTSIASGNNPTGVGEWYETNVRYPGGRYGAGVAYDKGKVYILGGGCASPHAGTYSTGTISQSGTTVTGSGTTWTDDYIGGTITYQDASTATIVSVNSTTSLTVSVSKTVAAGQTYSIAVPRHIYGVLKSQPQIAKYSRMIDTDTDVFPTKWLMNGLDNSTGAEWYLRYRSMTDIDGDATDCVTAMTTWGQETNFGAVTLGLPQNYIPRDGSGTNTNCARYFYFSVSIDASRTFGYPDDVSRGPTIYDLSLFYTADPSKRLIHGKTFTGGEQQPLDTPF